LKALLDRSGLRVTAVVAVGVLAGALAGTLVSRASALANEPPTPVGLWKTFDDRTGKPRALVRITDQDGELVGVVEDVLPVPGQPDDPVCVACTGDRKDRPITGMEILWGLSPRGDNWSGGTILDPESGKTYRLEAEVIDQGRRLKLRGFLGLSLFGRTQYWQRQE